MVRAWRAASGRRARWRGRVRGVDEKLLERTVLLKFNPDTLDEKTLLIPRGESHLPQIKLIQAT